MGKLIYNTELMDSITENYNQCVARLDETILLLAETHTKLNDNYEGQAKQEIAVAVFSKITEHLELLKDCCNSAGAYVAYTKNSMLELDDNIGKAFRKTDKLQPKIPDSGRGVR